MNYLDQLLEQADYELEMYARYKTYDEQLPAGWTIEMQFGYASGLVRAIEILKGDV